MVEISTYRHVKSSLRPLCFQEIGSTTVRACAASQPVLTPYTLLEIERSRSTMAEGSLLAMQMATVFVKGM
jgi:hypothetical protein